ncbi:MAG: hypothetical protein ACI8PZ_006433 [Myxococcota bacterium]|jgi:hypothetical protein
MLIALLVASTTAFAGAPPPTLSLDGACPGPIDISITLSAGSTATVLYASGTGSSTLPFGRCAGVATGLDSGRWAFNAPDGDGDGALSFSPSVPDAACGQWLQVLDTTTCLLSDAVEIGAVGAPADCDPATEVEADGRCYYLDGSGGACDPGYELAPQSVLASIAPAFTGKDYKNAVSDNCCIWHADQDVEMQDWGLSSDCNSPGPFSDGPTLGGAGCMDALNLNPAQLTLCQSTGAGFEHDNGVGVIWYNDIPTGTIDENQARLSCEQSYGVCYLSDGDCAGLGYCQDPSSGQCWGWEAGCSGDAGRVWQYGSSFTTYGYWN